MLFDILLFLGFPNHKIHEIFLKYISRKEDLVQSEESIGQAEYFRMFLENMIYSLPERDKTKFINAEQFNSYESEKKANYIQDIILRL